MRGSERADEKEKGGTIRDSADEERRTFVNEYYVLFCCSIHGCVVGKVSKQ